MLLPTVSKRNVLLGLFKSRVFVFFCFKETEFNAFSNFPKPAQNSVQCLSLFCLLTNWEQCSSSKRWWGQRSGPKWFKDMTRQGEVLVNHSRKGEGFTLTKGFYTTNSLVSRWSKVTETGLIDWCLLTALKWVRIFKKIRPVFDLSFSDYSGQFRCWATNVCLSNLKISTSRFV